MPIVVAEASTAMHLRTYVVHVTAQSFPKLLKRQVAVTWTPADYLPDRPALVTHHLPPVAAQHVLLRTRLLGTMHAAKPLPVLAQAFSDLAATMTRWGNAPLSEHRAPAKAALHRFHAFV